jgi:hypothetical protein
MRAQLFQELKEQRDPRIEGKSHVFDEYTTPGTPNPRRREKLKHATGNSP